MADDCTTVYEWSNVKRVVDAWGLANIPNGLQEARLLNNDDFEDLGYKLLSVTTSGSLWEKTNDVPDWVYDDDYWYWTSSQYKGSRSTVLTVRGSGNLSYDYGSHGGDMGVVRPVVTLKKSALE